MSVFLNLESYLQDEKIHSQGARFKNRGGQRECEGVWVGLQPPTWEVRSHGKPKAASQWRSDHGPWAKSSPVPIFMWPTSPK